MKISYMRKETAFRDVASTFPIIVSIHAMGVKKWPEAFLTSYDLARVFSESGIVRHDRQSVGDCLCTHHPIEGIFVM